MIDSNPTDTYESRELPILHEGMRVRLRAPSWGLTLRSATGTVVRPAEDDGEYVVRLDGPALYDHGLDQPQEFHELVETSDNLDVLDD